MALQNGIFGLQHTLTGQWINIGSQNTPTTVKQAIVFNFNRLQDVNSNAKKNGLSAYFAGMAIVRHAQYQTSSSGFDVVTAQVQREGCFSINIQQPNLSTKYQKQSENLALMGAAARVINPMFCALVDNCPPKQSILQDSFQNQASGNDEPFYESSAGVAFDRFSSLNQIESWNDNYNYVPVLTSASEKRRFTDATMIPACEYSGSSSHGSWLDKDIIPFACLTNNNMPWTVTVQCEIDRTNSIDSAATFETDKMDVWAYIVFRRATDTVRCGVLWSVIRTPIGDGNYNPMPLLYRGIFSTPNYGDTTQITNGITIPYHPENFFNFVSTSQIRLLDNGNQVFPLDSYSDAQKSLDHFNVGSVLGGNPKLRYDYFGNTTTTVSNVSNIILNGAGQFSSLPWFPFATNHLFAKGFPIAFLSDPQNAESRLQITYTTVLNSAQKANVVAIHVSEFYDQDVPKLLSYGLYGDSNQPAGSRLGSVLPLVDRLTNKSSIVRKLVPWEACR